MEGMFNAFIVMIIFIIVFIVGGIFLQIRLSKKENKWLGLILPLICLMMSFIPVLGNMAFYSIGEVVVQELASDETMILETIELNNIEDSSDSNSFIAQTIYIFVIYNLPTAILFLVYFACRENMKKRKMLDKMNIQDL